MLICSLLNCVFLRQLSPRAFYSRQTNLAIHVLNIEYCDYVINHEKKKSLSNQCDKISMWVICIDELTVKTYFQVG